MYDLQRILMDAWVKKNNIEIVNKLKSNDGTWRYFLKPYVENGETCYPFTTAMMIFPDKFDDGNNYNFESTFNEYN